MSASRSPSLERVEKPLGKQAMKAWKRYLRPSPLGRESLASVEGRRIRKSVSTCAPSRASASSGDLGSSGSVSSVTLFFSVAVGVSSVKRVGNRVGR